MTHIVSIVKPLDKGKGIFHIEDAGTLWLNNSTLQSAIISPSKEYKTDKEPVFLFSIEIDGKVVFHDGNKDRRDIFIQTYLGYSA